MADKKFRNQTDEEGNRVGRKELRTGSYVSEQKQLKVEAAINNLMANIDAAISDGNEYLEKMKEMESADNFDIEETEAVVKKAQEALLALKEELVDLSDKKAVKRVGNEIEIERKKIKKMKDSIGEKKGGMTEVDKKIKVVKIKNEDKVRKDYTKYKKNNRAEETDAELLARIKRDESKRLRINYGKAGQIAKELVYAYNASLLEPINDNPEMSEEEIVEEIKKVRNELATAKRFLGKIDDAKLIGEINLTIKMKSDHLEVLRAKIDNPEVIKNMMVEELKERFADIKKIEDEKIKLQELIRLAHVAFEFGDDDFIDQIEDAAGIPKSVRWNKIKSVEVKPKLRWRVPNENTSGPEWEKKMHDIRVLKGQIGEIPKNFPDKEKREELRGRRVYLSQRVYKQEDPTEKSKAYYILGKKYYEEHVPEEGFFDLMNEWHKLLAEKKQYEDGSEVKEAGEEIKIADRGETTADEIEIKQAEQAEDVAVVGEDEIVAITPDDEMEAADFFAEMPIAETPKVKEVINEVKRLPAADKKTLFEGLADIGFKTSEVKNRVVKNFLRKVGDGIENKVIANFFSKYSDIYQKQEDDAKRMQEIVGKSGLSKISGVGQGAGLVLKFGRIGFDVMSRSSAYPLRYVTMAGMVVGQGMEAAKEVRFENEEAIKKTRVDDADRAVDEARLIYNKVVKEGGDKITKEDLDKIYREQLPADIKNRLDRMKDSGTSFVQKILNKHVDLHIGIINKKIKKINEDKKLSSDDREQQIEELLLRNADFLHDLDRMVGDVGLIDNIAYYSRLAEKTSKMAANLVMVDSVYRLASAGWNMLHLTEKYHDIFGHGHHTVPAHIGQHAVESSATATSLNPVPIAQPFDKQIAEPFTNFKVGPSAESFAKLADQPAVEGVGGENIKITIGGNVNTFSGAIDKALHGADSEVKDNFIHQVLGENVEILEGDRQDLLHKAVAKLSIGEVHYGQEVPDLVHDGNNVILHHDGSWEVQKGEGVLAHEAEASAVVNHEEVKIKVSEPEDRIASPEDRIAAHEQIENFKRTAQVLQEFYNHGINSHIMEYIGVDAHDSNLRHDSRAMEKLNFLAKYEKDLDGFSRAADALKAIKGTDISPEDAFAYYDNFKSFEGDGPRLKAVIELMKRDNVEKSLFNLTGVKVTEENFEIKNGVIKIKDYYKKGFDFVLTNKDGEIKIGVDGPSRFNWKARGWWGNLRPDELLSAESLKEAKEAVEKMSQDLENLEPKN